MVLPPPSVEERDRAPEAARQLPSPPLPVGSRRRGGDGGGRRGGAERRVGRTRRGGSGRGPALRWRRSLRKAGAISAPANLTRARELGRRRRTTWREGSARCSAPPNRTGAGAGAAAAYGAARAISSDFRSGAQQDAQEFLRCLLDKLDEDFIVPRPSEESSSTEEGSAVKEIFRGCLKSQLRCPECNRCQWRRQGGLAGPRPP